MQFIVSAYLSRFVSGKRDLIMIEIQIIKARIFVTCHIFYLTRFPCLS